MKKAYLYLIVFMSIWATGIVSAHEGYGGNKDLSRDQKIKNLSRSAVDFSEIYFSNLDPDGNWTPAQPRNELDQLTFQKMKDDGVPVNALCGDADFLRRTGLLLTGRLPDRELVRTFLADTNPEKRSALVETLLASDAFNTHWAFWFQEYFESTQRLLRRGQLPYNDYLAEAVAQNKPLDLLAMELLTLLGSTEEVPQANFYARANEMVRLQQDFWDNAAIHASGKFLGVPLQCISCHDGAYHLENINLYLADRKREDLWGMAAFFSGIQRRPNREGNLPVSLTIFSAPSRGYNATSDSGDRPVRDGGLITPKYLFDQTEPASDRPAHEVIAEKIVNDRQFARNWANRFWGHLFGLAMVEPMDAFDLYRIDPDYPLPEGWTHQALHLNLLEHMTDQMIAFNYDLRSYLRYILNSATFQMSSDFKPGNWQEKYAPYYTRYLARHMSAEMVYDAIVSGTGVAVPMSSGTRDRNVFYAHELMDNLQPRGNRSNDIFTFLQTFGRGNRFDIPRTNDGAISQALLLMNSPVINQRLISPDSHLAGYLQAGMSGEAIVRELYLDIYCREPAQTEIEQLLSEMVNFEPGVQQATTALWLLLNKVAFSFIY